MARELSDRDWRDFQAIERQIAADIEAFHRAGRRLLEVYRRGLYRFTHDDWEGYLSERWGFSRGHRLRLVWAGEVLDDLADDAHPRGCAEVLPETERQTRPLKPLDPETRREVWEDAVGEADSGQPSASLVDEIAARARADPRVRARLARQEEERLLRRDAALKEKEAEALDRHHLRRAAHCVRQAARHLETSGGQKWAGDVVLLRELEGRVREELGEEAA